MRLACLIIACAAPVAAQDLSLTLPLDCTLGDTCYIQNYVDHDPSEGASDFQCGSLTYDDHKGTDFGLPNLAAMEQGVDVFASAAGTVRGVRNDMRDVLFTPELEGEISGRDCGNGVVIAHEDGWETQYCHMRQGSIGVVTGDRVMAGDVLGQVGLSGRTQFPHVHISVRRDGLMVDPFDPDGTVACDAPVLDTPVLDTLWPVTLWADDLGTPAGGVLSIGFSDGIPEYDAVKAGTAAAQTLRADAPIVVWAFAFGARVNDVVTLEIDGPEGALFQTDDVLTRQQAIFMRAGGLNPPDVGWPSGLYTGRAIHSRDGIELSRRTTQISLP